LRAGTADFPHPLFFESCNRIITDQL
jgi:hypothetical protein